MGEIKSYRDLTAYQEAHKLVLLVYKLIENFPLEEKFALANQMKRCAVSIASNIAEGFARGTAKDKISFYTIARGSVSELDSQALISKDLHYLSESSCLELLEQISRVSRLVSGLVRSAPNR